VHTPNLISRKKGIRHTICADIPASPTAWNDNGCCAFCLATFSTLRFPACAACADKGPVASERMARRGRRLRSADADMLVMVADYRY
jgi:hypothetical protein